MPPPAPRPDSAVVGGAWLTVVGCSMRSTLPASEAGIGGQRGIARVAGQHDQRGGAGEHQCARVARGALRNAGQDRLGDVTVGDPDDPVVGGVLM